MGVKKYYYIFLSSEITLNVVLCNGSCWWASAKFILLITKERRQGLSWSWSLRPRPFRFVVLFWFVQYFGIYIILVFLDLLSAHDFSRSSLRASVKNYQRSRRCTPPNPCVSGAPSPYIDTSNTRHKFWATVFEKNSQGPQDWGEEVYSYRILQQSEAASTGRV